MSSEAARWVACGKCRREVHRDELIPVMFLVGNESISRGGICPWCLEATQIERRLQKRQNAAAAVSGKRRATCS